MEKDDKIFDKWNNEKKEINKKDIKRVYINQREIWFTKMGKNIGFEEDGKENFLRPVLVIKKIGNLFLTVAMTSKGKDSEFYYRIKNLILQNPKYKDSSFLILSQIKVMDKKRFFENVRIVDENEFNKIKEKLKTFLF